MSGFNRGYDNIFNSKVRDNYDDGLRVSFVGGRIRLRRHNAQRDFKSTVIVGLIFVIGLIIMVWRVSAAPGISRSTKAREKVNPSSQSPLIVINDSANLVDDTAEAESGMKEFFDKTGVAPCVIIVGDSGKKYSSLTDDELDKMALDSYVSLFDDDDHLMVVMFQTGEYKFRYGMHAGGNAAGFMDNEARQILSECIDHYIFEEKSNVRYANDKMAGGKAISDAFTDAADRLMKKGINYVYVAAAGGIVLFAVVFAGSVKRKKRRGKLTIDKEYLPGEYVPGSVVRQSDTDNLGKGIKYRYGSEGVAGDLPMGTLMSSDMLRSCLKDQPKAEMDSVHIPKGVYVNFSASSAQMDDAVIPGTNRSYNQNTQGGFTKSTLQYRDNKGNFVYQNNTGKTDESFDGFAKEFNQTKAQTAFKDEAENFGTATAVYRDGKGGSHLLRNEGGTDESFDDWAENYRKTMGQSAFVDEGDIYPQTEPQTAPQPEVPQPPKQADSAEEQLKKWNAFYGINTTPEQDEELTSELDMKSKDAEWEKAYSQLDNNE